MSKQEAIRVATLGAAQVRSPLTLSTTVGDGVGNFVPENAFVRYRKEVALGVDIESDPLFEAAGPRERVYFDPNETRVAIVTCGGLCPGLNNVIRSVTLELFHNYGVKDVFGVRFGYRGLNPDFDLPLMRLHPENVERIHNTGGTILGTSRGDQDVKLMVDFLEAERINILICVGGDGTQRGAHAIHEEIARREKPISVIGVPKTIDNDLLYCEITFGFNTAIDEARDVLQSAHNEARSGANGVGLVKLMGRHSGFIAAGATVASGEVNFTLVPEIPFKLEGDRGFLTMLEKRLQARQHAVIAVAEGAGQELIPGDADHRDLSGNVRFQDIGLFLKQQISAHFNQRAIPVDLKYIDPSYIIRSVPANCHDALLCDQLARRAVHAGMAGKTDTLIGIWNRAFMHVPIEMAVQSTKRLDPEGEWWASVLAATGQPREFV